MRRTPLLASLVLSVSSFPAVAQEARTVAVPSGDVRVETVASGLVHPWGLAFLPDGRMLVTERPGRLRVVSQDGSISDPLKGAPEVYAQNQGGLLDVVLAPDFETSRHVYLTFAETGDGGVAGTAVARGRLGGDASALEDVKVIFRQEPKVEGAKHFGSRLVFSRDGRHMFVTLADRDKFDPAQDLGNHIGTVLRLDPNGRAPRDNPFVGRGGALPEIWSYGHRNIQAAALHPDTGDLLVAEMGPKGGDELNRPEPGKNFGWPAVSWGEHYDGRNIPDPPTKPDFADALHHWTPVISPSGMTGYTGDLFPAWRGSMLIGGLSARAIVRVTLKDGAYGSEERIDLGARVRDVAQGPDGAVYAITDAQDGSVLKITPNRP